MYIFNSKFPGGFQANNDDVLSRLKKETQSERALKSSGQGCSRQMCLFLLLLAPLPEGPPLPSYPRPGLIFSSSAPPPKFNIPYYCLKVISSDL